MMTSTLLTAELPRLALRVLPTARGYELMLDHPDHATPPVRIATVHDTGRFAPGGARAYANCLAAALLMLHSLDDLIEFAQPELWSDEDDIDQANTWRAAFRAHLHAQGMGASAHMMMDIAAVDKAETPVQAETGVS